MMHNDPLQILYRAGQLAELDLHFAHLMDRLAGSDDPTVRLASALVSQAAASGHVCLDLTLLDRALLLEAHGGWPGISCPPAVEWIDRLCASPVVGLPGELRPLIMDGSGRLYLYRYWSYENHLIAAIRRRASGIAELPEGQPLDRLRRAFDRLFPISGGENEVDWQKVAAVTVLLKRLCVISGGPGTGKTHTVAKILALLMEQAGDRPLKFMLAASTGKAAAKLSDSLKAAGNQLNCSAAVRDSLPKDACTVHRLLRPVFGTPYFHYNAENPLPADIVVVDEASMVDLALLSKLMAALSDKTRLVLIGDKDQLASVEAGAVMGDICNRDAAQRHSSQFCKAARRLGGLRLVAADSASASTRDLQDCIVELLKSHRFEDDGGIVDLSRAVKQGDGQAALAGLKSNRASGIFWQPVASARDFNRNLRKHILRGYRDYLSTDDPHVAMERFGRFKILCAVNKGRQGVGAVNRLAEEVLRRENLIGFPLVGRNQGWYTGRPVMMTGNDYLLGLYNGDIGLTVGEADSQLAVCFPKGGQGFRSVAIHRLLNLQTVFAMTVHKSQGSEFEEVHLILPEADSPLLTRELIYTAVTRARSKVTIWGREAILTAAISRRIVRHSGLRSGLWGDDAGGLADA